MGLESCWGLATPISIRALSRRLTLTMTSMYLSCGLRQFRAARFRSEQLCVARSCAEHRAPLKHGAELIVRCSMILKSCLRFDPARRYVPLQSVRVPWQDCAPPAQLCKAVSTEERKGRCRKYRSCESP